LPYLVLNPRKPLKSGIRALKPRELVGERKFPISRDGEDKQQAKSGEFGIGQV
jgi:hypothetical protein